MPDSHVTEPIRALRTGPEQLFDISEMRSDGPRLSGSMPTGPWLHGADGRPTAGSLGVLLDDVVGYAVLLGRPSGTWSVSSEISVDVVGAVPSGSRVVAVGTIEHADAAGGIASGRIVDDDGRLVALCRQHGRWVAAVPPDPDGASVAAAGPGERDYDGILDLIGAEVTTTTDGAELVLAPSARVVNPLGILHGGIALCASDVVASAALVRAGRPLATASIRVSYVRPVPVDAPVSFRATVVHAGRGLGVVQVTSFGAAGKPCTIATVTAVPRRE